MDAYTQLESQLTKLGAPPSTLIEKFIQGAGSGGQKVNKTSSCIYLKHISTSIEVKCQSSRSREQNRLTARTELVKKLKILYSKAKAEKRKAMEKKRRTNRPRSRNSKNRMLKTKKRNSEKKNLRRKPVLGD